MKGKWFILLFLVCCTSYLLPTLASGATYYVNAGTGSDTANNCSSSSSPCKTISHAVTQVPSGTSTTPNIISIAAGTYNVATNGETFPIAIGNSHIRLMGASGATTIIDVESASSNGFNISGDNVSFSGLTFDNSSIAIHYNDVSGYTVNDCIFTSDVNTGIRHVYQISSSINSISVAPVSITDNQFNCSTSGISLNYQLGFNGITTGLSATTGSITITDNIFTGCTNGILLEELSIRKMTGGAATVGTINLSDNTLSGCGDAINLANISVEDIDNSTLSLGNINLASNTIDNSGDGIRFDGYFGSSSGQIRDSTVNVGDISITANNITNSGDYGIYVDYFDIKEIYGSSAITLGKLIISGNDISSRNGVDDNENGIYINNVGEIDDVFNTSTITTGIIDISNNTIESELQSIYLRNNGVDDIGIPSSTDTALINFGATTISSNHVTSFSRSALDIKVYSMSNDQYAQTDVNVGKISIHNNTVATNSTDSHSGIYLYYSESGYGVTDDATLDLAGASIMNNTVVANASYGIRIVTAGIAYYVEGNSRTTCGPFTISGNSVTSDDEALFLDLRYVANGMSDSSSLVMSPWTISNNTLSSVTPDTAAVHITYGRQYAEDIVDDSTATLPDWIITGNTIDVQYNKYGLYVGSTDLNPKNIRDNASGHLGSITVRNNVFNPNMDAGMDRAIFIFSEKFCTNCDDASSFSSGDVTISDNTINNCGTAGIEVEFDEFGNTFDANGSATLGDILINNNSIKNTPIGINVDFHAKTENSAAVTLGKLTIENNNLTNIKAGGIYYRIDGDKSGGSASLTFGKAEITGNEVTALSSGAFPGSFGLVLDNLIDPGVVLPEPSVEANTFSNFHYGAAFSNGSGGSFTCNTFSNNSVAGLYFSKDGSFSVKHNAIVDNGVGIRINGSASATIQATDNWWGSPLGPVACSSCNTIDQGGGSVTYSPWLTEDIDSFCSSSMLLMTIPAIIGTQQN